ncbi:MAG: hypothetical protein RLZZ280_1270 [Pseudomonadota bacterium]
MKTGTVIGRIVASKRLPELPAGALLEVQLDYPKDVVVCYDPMGCGIGERVMITIGAPAAWWFAPAHPRVVADALIIASLDNYDPPHRCAERNDFFPSPFPSTLFFNPFFFNPSRRLSCHKPSE